MCFMKNCLNTLGISQMIDESQLAAFFNNGNLILSIMNQKLL